jgi:GNAT-family acetyltransferase (TIGR03103 family)
MREEQQGERDIATYVMEPQIVLSYAPQRLFLDPSDMLRLELDRFESGNLHEHVRVQRVESREQAEAINRIYLKREMVPIDTEFVWEHRSARDVVFLVAIARHNDQVLGTVTGLDHKAAFDDPENGSSLWCLAVDPTASLPGIGEALVRILAEHFKSAGRQFMDLSVFHDNRQAKALYEKLGFEKLHTFSIKTKNAHNEALFLGPDLDDQLNPYARIIVDEARNRGINVEVLDEQEGYFRLSRGGKRITCRESLSELTNAIAMSRCQDKYVTHRWLDKAGLNTPSFQLAADPQSNIDFLAEHGKVVVKPTLGEQGKGITVGVSNENGLAEAIERASHFSDRVLLESFHAGQDLRIIVNNNEVVAAAVRRPAAIVGDGKQDARRLIEKQSRRREAATDGESRIPLDAETMHYLGRSGYAINDVIPVGETVLLRKTANLHTGGTIHDVTGELHADLHEVAEKAARTLDMPVVGLDLLVESVDKPDYVIIEANERPGLANHEPQPTAQRFVDLLFPLSISQDIQHGSRNPKGAPGETKGQSE